MIKKNQTAEKIIEKLVSMDKETISRIPQEKKISNLAEAIMGLPLGEWAILMRAINKAIEESALLSKEQ